MPSLVGSEMCIRDSDDLKKVELEKSRSVETSVRSDARAVAFVVGRLER